MTAPTHSSSPRVAINGPTAAIIHRLSGIGLALFLPLHFLALGTAVNAANFNEIIAWSNHPLLKLTEWLLVTALAIHLAGGLRLLAIELFGVAAFSGTVIAAALATGIGTGVLFLLNAFG